MFPNAITFPNLTRTAQEAADQIGCPVGAICKSIIFRAGDGVVLVLTSGSNKVDTKKVEALLGTPLEKADADFVKEKSGFVIGGVAPWGHKTVPTVFIDVSLAQFSEIWASAGTANSVFPTTYAQLIEKTGAQEVAVA
ncbi:MAG: hypothetical protein RI911_776 [Candidatus Parcubacteria bacterium]|jgi:prolyl-tRNA editing enzyme YbaK/EbsC (Cys-tRNA(Pro) deacylase)